MKNKEKSMEDIKIRYCKFHKEMDTCEWLFEQHQLGKI